MTLDQIQRSEKLREFFHALLQNRNFALVLDAIQQQAVPSRVKLPLAIPGVHHDTLLAHDAQYRAGWADCVQAIKNLAGPSREEIQHQDEEEPWASVPEVAELDRQIALKNQKAQAQPTP
jgi:hypothetical protein